MNKEDVSIIESLLYNILSTLNTLLVATCIGTKKQEDKEHFLEKAQETHDILVNINLAKQHNNTYKSCFGCKEFDLNHIATLCRCDLNSRYHRLGCRFKDEPKTYKNEVSE